MGAVQPAVQCCSAAESKEADKIAEAEGQATAAVVAEADPAPENGSPDSGAQHIDKSHSDTIERTASNFQQLLNDRELNDEVLAEMQARGWTKSMIQMTFFTKDGVEWDATKYASMYPYPDGPPAADFPVRCVISLLKEDQKQEAEAAPTAAPEADAAAPQGKPGTEEAAKAEDTGKQEATGEEVKEAAAEAAPEAAAAAAAGEAVVEDAKATKAEAVEAKPAEENGAKEKPKKEADKKDADAKKIVKKSTAKAKSKSGSKSDAKKPEKEAKKEPEAAAVAKLEGAGDPNKPVVFFDISAGSKNLGRIEIQLHKDIVPKTAENFRCLCTGEKNKRGTRKPLTYKGNKLHRIIPGFMAQGGDLFNDGGGESIYGKIFNDENFTLKHDLPGTVSMANSGANTNSSQFFMCFRPSPDKTAKLDGKHVVFGQVVKGIEVLKEVENYGDPSGKPTKKVLISNCGQLS